MAPCETTDDYYALLEVPQTATLEIIRKSYLRLAVALHPDKNANKPDATASFQCLSRAYETLKDPGKRQAYDVQWVRIKHRQSTEQEAKKRRAEAAETERKRAAEETSSTQREQRASQERLRQLEQLRSNYDSNIFEVNRVIRRLATDLERLQEQDDKELRKERERNSWLTYFSRPIYGKAEENEGQKQQREIERLRRLASKSIKGSELNQKEARLQSLKSALQDVNRKIAAEEGKSEEEARARARAQAAKRQEQLRKEQEAKRRLEEQQEREREAKREAAAKLWREEAARAAKEARDAQEAREVQERARAAREAEAARQKNRSKPATASDSSYRASASNNKSICRHSAFWPKLQGSHLCSNCHTIQRRFAFQCPGCRLIACGSCRQCLRGERGRNDRNSSSRFGYNSDNGPDTWGNSYYD